MDASKENAKKALKLFSAFGGLPDTAGNDRDDNKRKRAENFITEFIQAAVSRLPSAAAIARDKERRKTRRQPVPDDDGRGTTY